MRKKTKGRNVQVVKNADGTEKIINHNWTYKISANRTTKTYQGKHYGK